MYTPSPFREDRPGVLHAFIRAHSFAVLVTAGGDGEGVGGDGVGGGVGPVATHLPLLLDAGRGPRGTLAGHLALPNGQARALERGEEVLAVFTGPHAYISPAWYVSPRNVPTWNYTAVHAYGRARVMDGPALRAHLEEIVEVYESARAAPASPPAHPAPHAALAPWRIGDAPAEFVEKLQRGVVGFEVEITRLEGKWKMSQNRTAEDRDGAIAGLLATGDPEAAAVAGTMRERGAGR